MSIDAVASIGLADAGAIPPVGAPRAVGGRGALLVRPASSGATASGITWSSESPTRVAPTERARPRQPLRGTAHQSNADGDSATFSSRMGDLTHAERTQLHKLRRRDSEVRTHESAHVAAGGGLVRGGPSYETQTGPDGHDYAVGGHVRIDSSPGDTHEETIARAQRIRQAALAPAEPSGQDIAVAAKASRMEAAARAALARTRGGASTGERNANSSLDRVTPPDSSPRTHAEGGGLDLVA